MHLSSITIKGFKSFPERTKLVFSPGVSVIVGPNGCGKSNVTDAVLWALGEQSPLSVRGQSMQDMIYAGGEGTGQSRFAEVEVVIDDEGGEGELAEIAIARRLERGGEGGYRLNGARARLVDVIEVLSDAGLGREMHSVISQGRVEEIVLSAPRERRLLVEEAAGLGKHRKRRRRAQLKLERTEANLDRALDVEREARGRLRPLKRQAQAAEIHARLERETAELRARVLTAELDRQDAELATAERTAASAREARDGVDSRLAEVAARRAAIEGLLAERDRTRTEAWGRLTAVQAAHERLTVRAEALARRRVELAAALEASRAALGSLADELEAPTGGATAADPVADGLERIEAALTQALEALAAARATAAEPERAAAIARIREAAAGANRIARRLDELLGSRRQGSLAHRLESRSAIAAALGGLCEATADARDAAGERAAALERRMLGEGAGDDFTERLRACSREEAEAQARLRSAADELTGAEVRLAHLGERRGETAAELERVAAVVGHPLEPAEGELGEPALAEIEAKLERLARRREQLGPVNPLAQSEYEEALAHVDDLERQRADLERALSELESLIRDTDRKIHAAFEQTFEATRQNFDELVEHLFPGGRGRLRLVDDRRTLNAVLGGAPPEADADGIDSDPDSVDSGDELAAQGIEIEVTPAGKATRRLSLLSGGEKALVALAFVFSVFLARPSPFYILDEVEAALDDANIDRFLQLVSRFSDRAQFIIVTHQKRTMDAADVLYGVSMGTGGVTKVVSRRFEAGQAELADAA